MGYSFDQLVPISIVSTGPLVLVVHPSLGVKSVQELIAAAKAQPGRINYGSGAKGTSLHLAAELFKHAANVDLQQIPYVGTNALIPDMLTGRVPVVFISPLIAKQHVAQGSVLALGVTSATRSPAWPDTPTIAEAGLRGYSFETWYAVLAPLGTPKAIIDKLSVAIAEAVRSAEASEKLRSLGNVPVGSTPADAASYIETEAMRLSARLESLVSKWRTPHGDRINAPDFARRSRGSGCGGDGKPNKDRHGADGRENIRTCSRRLARRLVLAPCGRQAHGEWAQGIHAYNDRTWGTLAPSRRQNQS